VSLGEVVALIPMAALVAVMIFVSIATFDWVGDPAGEEHHGGQHAEPDADGQVVGGDGRDDGDESWLCPSGRSSP
jgi:hypothetical protein